MRIQSLALLAGATAAIAADTVTLFLPGFDSQNLVGKVIGSSGSTTTYVLSCPDSDSDDCGVPPNGITVAQGHSSVAIAYGGDSVTISEKCKYDATTVSCSVSMNESGLTTAFQTGVPMTEIPGALMPVTITGTDAAGASATTGASASASTAASTLATSASDNTAASTATGTSTAGSSDSSSVAATSQTETGNAAMPMITGNARWAAAGGVAAALAFAAL
ncbi:unnamed protein product [Penicillium bialowiezense]